MTQSNGENPQRTRSGLHRIRDGIQSRSLLARKRVENITKDDVKGFFMRNAFVILTVVAVIIGKWEHILLTLFRQLQSYSLACFVDLKLEITGDFVPVHLSPRRPNHYSKLQQIFCFAWMIHQSGVTSSPIAGRKKGKNRSKCTRWENRGNSDELRRLALYLTL